VRATHASAAPGGQPTPQAVHSDMLVGTHPPPQQRPVHPVCVAGSQVGAGPASGAIGGCVPPSISRRRSKSAISVHPPTSTPSMATGPRADVRKNRVVSC
jgi:hypothetical protein